MKIEICIAQIGYRAHDLEDHIRNIKDIIARNRSSDLIVFPELILHGHPSLERPEGLLYRRIKKYYQSLRHKSDDLYKHISDVGARVIIGELKGTPGKFYNTATYIDKKEIKSYIKTHVHWTEGFIPGNSLPVFKSPFGKIGINICFDAAFMEVWRVLALKGARVIVNISAAPATFPVDHMWLRLKSAALNNQVFVIYANRPGDYFSGYSAVFNPRGETIKHAAKDEEVFRARIELDEARIWRKEERLYKNRRPLLYREITGKSIKK